MTDVLRREYAPITDDAWREIDDEARRVIKQNLSGRRVVDLDGPHGWEYAAVNTGRLGISNEKAPFGVPWGSRTVLALIETRLPFTLKRIELDDLSRGAKEPDLGPLQHAAEQVARLEDTAVFNGFAAGGIEGLLPASTQKAVSLPKAPDKYVEAVSTAVKQIMLIGIRGPYSLILGPDEYFGLWQARAQGLPPYRVIRDMIGGDILLCPSLLGGALVSTRGGDFELTIGQDFAVGYNQHDKENVEFFITESFTFRALEPAAAVELTRPA
jgi:uncharacterized linocin/CFP29 family protein